MLTSALIIEQTKKWINDVVVGCNFCPFAANVVKQQKVHYQVETSPVLNACLASFMQEVARLDDDTNIETSFLIFSGSFQQFDEYLNLVSLAEKLLKKEGEQF